MNDRRQLLKLMGAAALLPVAARAQGFAGLGSTQDGFQAVVPGVDLTFPKDHGAHPAFRTEWWYVTANLRDAKGDAYGIQWTLFRQALAVARAGETGFADPTVWMGHAALTETSGHRFDERLARGSTGEAGVTAVPFRAQIDDWSMSAAEGAEGIDKVELKASSKDFAYDLMLTGEGPLVLHGDRGFSRKSEGGQASYYYSQPFYAAAGKLDIDGRRIDVEGKAWLDREWSSQPLSPDQTGWDWFSLHLGSGRKLMLFQLRAAKGKPYCSGTFIEASGASSALHGDDIAFEPLRFEEVAGRRIPVAWRVRVASLGLDVRTEPLTSGAWMGTSVSYWEGPISFAGTETGVGYLEMTGY